MKLDIAEKKELC